MATKNISTISGALFALMALLQLLRVLLGWPAQIANWQVPIWASVIAVLVTGTLAYLNLKK